MEQKIISKIKGKNTNEIYLISPAAHTEIIEDGKPSKYGLATLEEYGHCKLIKDFNSEIYRPGECLYLQQANILKNRIKYYQLYTGQAGGTGQIQYIFATNDLKVKPSQIIVLQVCERESGRTFQKVLSINYNKDTITIVVDNINNIPLDVWLYIDFDEEQIYE